MAIVTDSSNYLSTIRTHSNNSFTAMFNVYVRNITADYSVFYGFDGISNPSLGIAGSGDRFALEDNHSETVGSTILVANTWYFVCWYRDAGTDFLEVNDIDQGVGTVESGNSPSNTYIGRFPGGGYNAGATRLDGVKIWNALLSTEERRQERYTIKPQRWADLWAWLPCNVGGDNGADWSGLGNWTITGSPTQESPAPVSWGDSYNNNQLIYISPPLVYIARPELLLAT